MMRYRIVIVGLAVLLVGGGSVIGLRHSSDRVIAANSGLAELLAGPIDIESHNVIGVANQQGASRLRSMVY